MRIVFFLHAQEEELNFGTGAAENALLFVRLVSILIFTVHNLKRDEWLACSPDVAAVTSSEVDEKQSITKSLETGPMCMDDDDGDGTCFFNMSRYEEEEEETGNRLALWEDFELQ
ncbi:hypothetical protein V6N11_002341 [Hibiscus sabdariffa]|uniref:Uncharacterized protein n=1 Tax=Hibiscus sabdariffa TaxID=183260 RepID=A0ABR2S9X6_9ROSI